MKTKSLSITRPKSFHRSVEEQKLECSCCYCSQNLNLLKCGHYQCSNCAEKYKKCVFCGDSCNICRKEPISSCLFNENKVSYGIGEACKISLSCKNCKQNWSFVPTKNCLNCSSNDEKRIGKILIKCLICDKFKSDISKCSHICSECFNKNSSCIYCDKTFLNYYCELCTMTSSKLCQDYQGKKICDDCYSKSFCHLCKVQYENLYQNEKCGKNLCEKCYNFIKIFESCPICSDCKSNICIDCSISSEYSYICSNCYSKRYYALFQGQNPQIIDDSNSSRSLNRRGGEKQIRCSTCNDFKIIPALKNICPREIHNETDSKCVECLGLVQCNACKKYKLPKYIKNDEMICKKCLKKTSNQPSHNLS